MGVRRRPLLLGGIGAGVAAGLGGAFLWQQNRTGDRALEPGNLTVLSGRDQSPGGQRQQLVDQWNAAHPDNFARIFEVGGVADAHRSEMVARAQSGAVARDDDYHVDVYNLDVTWTAEFAEAGYLHPLETAELDTGGFLAHPLSTCQYGGQLWALPFNTDAGLLYFRDDLVPAGDAPSDWGGIEARVAAVFAAPEHPGELVAGYAGQLADYEGLTVNALEMIWAMGGDPVRGHWRDPVIAVESDQVREALRRLARVYQDEDPQLILPEAVEFDEDATRVAFRDGKVVFMRHWPVAFRSLTVPPTGDASPVASHVARHTAVRRLPGQSALGGQNLALARDTPRPRAAQALIEFLTSEPSQRQLFRDGGLPATRRVVYDDPEVTAVHSYSEVLREAIDDARPRPVTPYYARFSEVFRQGVRQALRRQGEVPEGFAGQLADALRGVQR